MENRSFKALLVSESAEKTFSREITTRQIDDLPDGDVVIKVAYS